MYRRRRRSREIPFSLDSFLDVVANVVGIIVKLILIVWVGARSYSSIVPNLDEETPDLLPAVSPAPAKPLPGDPLEMEIARHRLELQQAQSRLLEQLRLLPQSQSKQEMAKKYLSALLARKQALERDRNGQELALAEQGKAVQGIQLSMSELRQRSKRLAEELAALEKQPAPRKVLRYRTPVSRPVHNEELHFECRRGRVSFVDLGAFVPEIQNVVHSKDADLHARGRLEGVTRPSGAFQMQWVVKEVFGGSREFEGDVVPLAEMRGETMELALAQGSEFRQIVEGADAGQTVVTFWVYPDSFPIYRKLRDFLYERDMEVAGRAIPEGVSIHSSSSRGSRSRGQ